MDGLLKLNTKNIQLMKKEGGKGRTGFLKWNKQQNGDIISVKPNISISTLNIKELNVSLKRQRLSAWVEKRAGWQRTALNTNRQLDNKRMEKDNPCQS